MTMTTTTMEKSFAFTQLKDARGYVEEGDVLHCLLTKTYGDIGIFANAFIEKDGKTYSVSGLFKDFFGEEGTYVWAKVAKFNDIGKISFVLCEAPQKEETNEVITVPQQDNTTTEVTMRAEYEAELEKAKAEMRAEFELKLQEAENRMKDQLLTEEKEQIKMQISKITGTVSPKASILIEEMLQKLPASEVGKAMAIVAANHDASFDFVSKMQKVLWGCL